MEEGVINRFIELILDINDILLLQGKPPYLNKACLNNLRVQRFAWYSDGKSATQRRSPFQVTLQDLL